MGSFFARKASEKLAGSTMAPVGSWVRDIREQIPVLGQEEALHLAGLQAILAAGRLKGIRSSTAGAGSQPPLGKMMSELDSILRFEALGGFGRIGLGVPTAACTWVGDWAMEYSVDGAAAGSEISVPSYRTWNDSLANGEVLTTVRDSLARILLAGPDIVVRDEAPVVDRQFLRIRRDGSSPFADDYCDPPSDELTRTLHVPAQSSAIAKACQLSAYAVSEDPRGFVVPVAPSGDATAGILTVGTAEDGGANLRFDQPSGTPAELQRWRRRCLRLLHQLAETFAADEGSAAALRGFADSVDGTSPRIEGWIEAWTGELLTDQWTVVGGSLFPVAVLILSDHQPKPSTTAYRAAGSAALRKRTFTRGISQRSREANRIYTSRRPAVLTATSGGYLPYVRYVAHTDLSDGTVGLTTSKTAMFWEVLYRSVQLGEQAATLLSLTGLGTADGVVAYGDELWSFVEAFCQFAARCDPRAQFRTIYLRVPSS